MRIRHVLLAPAFLVLLHGVAPAADQSILGKLLSVMNPDGPQKQSVDAVASEKRSPNTIVGDPTLEGSAGGAVLDVFANGATSSNQSFVLPQGPSGRGKHLFWETSGKDGFKYSDPDGAQGPVKQLVIKRSRDGFIISAKITGKNGPVSLVPPNPGTDGCVSVKLGIGDDAVGDRYHVKFGPDAKIKNVGSKLFSVTKPESEGLCPTAGPTTTTTTTTIVTSTTSTTVVIPTTTTTSSTTTTTIYGSPSRAFFAAPADLLD